MLVIGGRSDNNDSLRTTEYLDLKENTFSAGPQMRVGRYLAAAVQIDEERILVAGGLIEEAMRTTEVLNLPAGVFSPGPALLFAHHTAVAVCL